MKIKKKEQSNSLRDMLNPEVKNIFEKLKELGNLTTKMGIDRDKCIDIEWLTENLPQMKYVEHTHFRQAVDLVSKLQKIHNKKS
jgi:hypothetical protein